MQSFGITDTTTQEMEPIPFDCVVDILTQPNPINRLYFTFNNIAVS